MESKGGHFLGEKKSKGVERGKYMMSEEQQIGSSM